MQRKTRQGNGHDCNEMRGRRAAAAAQPMIASRLMLRTLQTLVLVLVAALATATSAAAFAPESALRASHDFLQPSVGALTAQPREAHQQNTLGYGEVTSDASLAAEGGMKLAGGTIPELANSAYQAVARAGGTQLEKAALFENLIPQIQKAGQFGASRSVGTDGSVIFMGKFGEGLVIDAAGQVYRGSLKAGSFVLEQGGLRAG